MEALALAETLCDRLAASRAPCYDPQALREIEGLKTRIEAIVLDAHLQAEDRGASGRSEEAARTRAAAAELKTRLDTLLSSL